MPSNDSTANFEAGISRLSVIVDKLSSRDVPLAEAMELYKEGNDLVQKCRAQLDKAEFTLASIQERESQKNADDEGGDSPTEPTPSNQSSFLS